MWRLQLFLLLSTCFLIPHEAKPATSSTSSTIAPTAAKSTSNIGRLAAKDLADLLMASMEARNTKLSSLQQSTVMSLRDMEPTELKGGDVLLQLGMDVIIDILIGNNANASCDRVIKDIKKSMDKSSVTLSLKSFLALCAFNNIECSQKQVVQIIKGTTAAKPSETAMLGSRITRTALEQSAKTSNIRGDRDSIVKFLHDRTLPELSAILSTLLQVCGASSQETQNIVQNLIEMGPKDTTKKTGISVLQINGFSTLIVSLMDSLTSIANGNKSGFCAATPDSWIVRLLDMGVAKVIIMGLMTALDRSLPASPNSLMQKGNAIANLVDADVPLPKSSSLTSKRSSGSIANAANLMGNSISTGPENIVSGNQNFVGQLVGLNAPILASVSALTNTFGSVGGTDAIGGVGSPLTSALAGRSRSQNVANQGGNNINQGAKNVIKGDGNTVFKVVDADIPVLANVGALNSVTGIVTGSSGSTGGSGGSGGSGSGSGGTSGGGSSLSRSRNVANKLDNNINTGPKNIITGNQNQVTTLVDGQIPILADVKALNSVTGIVTGGSGGGVGSVLGGGGSGGRSGSSSQNIANQGGNNINMGAKNIVKGDGNTVFKAVDANIPILANVGALNSVTGIVTGSSGSSGVGGLLGGITGGATGSSGSQNIANSLGNNVNVGPKNILSGDNNQVFSVLDAVAPVNVGVSLLNTVVGTVTGGGGSSSGGAIDVVDQHGNLLMKIKDENGATAGSGSTGNDLSQSINSGPKQIVMGNDNKIIKLVNLDASVLSRIDLGNAIRGSSGVCNGIANKFDNEINSGPDNVIEGNRNSVITLLNLDLNVLLNIAALNTVIGEVGNDCPEVTTPEPPTQEPPTPSPPTPSPPTPSPPTPSPPTPSPPTPYPPTPQPPTPSPPTPSPPTPSPPTPNPNSCYRRYCRKWRTRPSYLCYKNCGGSYVYRP